MSLTTKMIHTICKSMCSMSLGMGVLMFGHGVGLLDAPDKMMTHTQNGEGVSKFDWLAEQATEQLGTPTEAWMVFAFIGACKILALIDLWLVKAATRLTLFCCALLWAGVAYGHAELDDPPAPPLALSALALVGIATAPSAVAVAATKPKPKPKPKAKKAN